MTDSICALPFNTLSISSRGFIRLCCSSTHNFMMEPYHIRNNPNGEWQKIQSLENVRQEMLQGKRPEICTRCWNLEDAGAISFRNGQNKFFKDTVARIKSGNTEIKLERLEIDLGNKCNLGCRMCHPASSSLLAEEIKNNPTRKWVHWNLENLSIDWFHESKLLDYIARYGHDLKSVYIIGGEPLIIDEHMELLEHLIALGFAKNIQLQYNTNLMNVGAKFYEIWKNFNRVSIAVSVDQSFNQYEYNRWPAKWEKLTRNLASLRAAHKDSPEKYIISIHTTVSNLTIPDLARSLDTYINDWKLRVFMINVDCPEEMYATVLPTSAKEKIIADLSTFVNGYKKDSYMIANLENLEAKINELQTALAPTEETINGFLRRMKYMDLNRGQNLFDYYTCFDEWRERYEAIT